MQERRKFQRKATSFIVMYRVNAPVSVSMHFGKQEINAIAADICEEGMGILTNRELPVPANVNVRFILVNSAAAHDADRLRSMELEAEVCYNLQEEGRIYRLGLRFMNISAGERAFIAHFVNMSHG